MFLRYNQTSIVETKWNASFQLYRSDILALHTSLFNQEDIYGRSCKQYKIAQYYLAFLYTYLIYRRYTDGVSRVWSYFEDLFNIEDLDKRFGCNGISLDKLFVIWDINQSSSGGRINPSPIGNAPIGAYPSSLTVTNLGTIGLLALIDQGAFCDSILTC